MNIKEAKIEIEGAIQAYLAKDDYGLYCIPFKMQRPIIMLGPPGVGKTAVVEQIAEEMDVNFVSYSITHHTRQSALGLPFIAQETFDGHEYSVSEYTMSEIIAAVYRAREKSGVDEGILFLDEVNCVSETLAPAMLQFLQYKTFGMHRLPEGWVIVTAGNPPEFNRAAREFDPAMLDRLMRIDVEADVNVWQEYAAAHGVHPAVTTYLDAKPGSFYKVRAAARGSKIVTSRGWEDLSRMLQAYERLGKMPSGNLYGRYLQDEETAEDFGVYYEIFRKYQDDYKVTDILSGKVDGQIAARAQEAPFDERIALVGLLIDAVLTRVRAAIELEEALKLVRRDLTDLKTRLGSAGDTSQVVARYADALRSASDVGKRVRNQVGNAAVVKAERLRVLETIEGTIIRGAAEGEGGYASARKAFNAECKKHAKALEVAKSSLDNALLFLDGTYGEDSQESLILTTKLAADAVLIRLVSTHGSEQYMKHNKSLLFTERGLGLLEEIEALED